MRSPLVLLVLWLIPAAIAWADRRPMTVDDLLKVQVVGDPQIAPDGKHVVYTVAAINPETGKSNSDLWLVPTAGGEPRRLTSSPGADNHPRWSPDGQTIAFVSDRGGSAQVWLLPFGPGEARALTHLPIDASGPIWSPRGDRIAFVAEVVPGASPEQTADKDREKADGPTRARTYDRLMMRHWMSWDEGKRSHLFVADVATGAVKDLTPNLPVNTPPAPFGGSSDYAFSPDGAELAFTAEPLTDAAWSTNTDIWVVPADGSAEPRNMTEKNRAADAQPSYSPDGQWLGYLSQSRPGFEADQWILRVQPRAGGESREISRALDRPIQSYVWAPDSRSVVATIDDGGYEPIVDIRLDGGNVPDMRALQPADFVKPLVKGATCAGAQIAADRSALVFVRHDAAHPPELFRAGADGADPKPLTQHNAPLVAELDLSGAESFSFRGAEGTPVQGWLVRPPGFDPAKKYPVAVLIHGGPQGAFHDEWHNRWNYGLFAAPGYAVVALNPRGSTGFGQTFTDQISGDWNGRVYDDLMLGIDHALKTYSFLDADRMAAAGGSYGGYMVNWICGHSNRFKALISHAGVFDLKSMYGTTEELWFPEWEFGGPPWEKPELYEKMSPSNFADRFQTPTLVIHGALDFRVPEAQGFGMFTCLQRRGVPSRLLWFPDEGHWILKSANRRLWWNEMHAWLDRYLRADSTPH